MRVLLLLFPLSLMAAGVTTSWWGSKGNGSTNASQTIYGAIGNGSTIGGNSPTAESSANMVFRTSVTLDKFCAYFSTMDRGAGTIGTRKASTFNTSITDGNLQIAITASGGAAEYCDNTHSDSVTAGEYWNYKFVSGSGGTTSILRHTTINDAPTTTGLSLTKFNNYINGTAVNNNTTTYYTLTSSVGATSTNETQVEATYPSTGTWRNLAVILSADTYSTNGTFSSRIGAAAGNQAVTIGTSAGIYEDNTHTDSITPGNLINYKYLSSTGTGSGTIETISSEIETTKNTVFISAGTINNSGAGNAFAAATTTYFHPNFIASSTTIGDYAQNIKVATTLSKLSALVNVDTLTAGQTAVIADMKSGSPGNLAATFTGGTSVPVYITDSTHSTSYATTDTFQWRIIVGAGTSVTIGNISAMLNYGAAVKHKVQ